MRKFYFRCRTFIIMFYLTCDCYEFEICSLSVEYSSMEGALKGRQTTKQIICDSKQIRFRNDCEYHKEESIAFS